MGKMVVDNAEQALLNGWKQPVGTLVLLRRDNGRRVLSRTRTEAWLLGGSAVVKVEGITSPYALTHVEVQTPALQDLRAVLIARGEGWGAGNLASWDAVMAGAPSASMRQLARLAKEAGGWVYQTEESDLPVFIARPSWETERPKVNLFVRETPRRLPPRRRAGG